MAHHLGPHMSTEFIIKKYKHLRKELRVIIDTCCAQPAEEGELGYECSVASRRFIQGFGLNIVLLGNLKATSGGA